MSPWNHASSEGYETLDTQPAADRPSSSSASSSKKKRTEYLTTFHVTFADPDPDPVRCPSESTRESADISDRRPGSSSTPATATSTSTPDKTRSLTLELSKNDYKIYNYMRTGGDKTAWKHYSAGLKAQIDHLDQDINSKADALALDMFLKRLKQRPGSTLKSVISTRIPLSREPSKSEKVKSWLHMGGSEKPEKVRRERLYPRVEIKREESAPAFTREEWEWLNTAPSGFFDPNPFS